MIELLISLLIYTEDDVTSIQIAETVQEIKAGTESSSAFDLCRNCIKSVSFFPNSQLINFGASLLANTVVEIVDFSNCPNLETIFNGCCKGCNFLKKFIFPPNILTLATGSIASNSLTELSFPNSLKNLNNWDEQYGSVIACPQLKRIDINAESQLEYIGNHAFMGSGIEDFFFPKKVTYTGVALFIFCPIYHFSVAVENPKFSTDGVAVYNKEGTEILFIASVLKTESFTVPAKVTAIKPQAFRFTPMKTVIFENQNVNLMEGCFYQSGIEELTYPTGSTAVTKNVIMYSEALRKVTLHDGITFIGEGAFLYCTNLTQIVMSARMEVISKGAFTACQSLRTVFIPNTVTIIGLGCFSGCNTDLELQLQEGNTRYRFEKGILYYNNKFIDYIKDSDDYDIIIPNDVPEIVEKMFMNKKLRSISFAEVSTTTVIQRESFRNSTIKTIALPPCLTTIVFDCFNNCSKLESVTVNGAISDIQYSAFANCTSLKTFDITSDALETINLETFINCTALTVFSFEKLTKLNKICESAFYNTGVQTINFSNSLMTIEAKAFACTKVTSVSFNQANIDNIPSYCFCNCTELSQITFSPYTKHIGTYAFSNCTSLTVVTLGTGIEVINQYAYAYSSNIGVVVIPRGAVLKHIMGFAFKGTELHSFRIEDKTAYSFEDNLLMNGDKTNLIYFISTRSKISVILPSSITSIGDYAFQHAVYLYEVIIPNGNNFDKIGYSSFEGCTALRRVVLPKTLNKIEEKAFKGCRRILCGGLEMNVDHIEQAREAGIPDIALSEGCINNLRAMLKRKTCQDCFIHFSITRFLLVGFMFYC